MDRGFLGSVHIRRLLDALEGVTYVTDRSGVIQEVGAAAWNDFAEENGAPHLTVDAVRGRSIFDMVAGEDVRDVYRSMHQAVVSGDRPRACFTFRCDSPGTERLMRMSISRLHGEQDFGVLYQSQLIRSENRPTMELFSREHLEAAARDDAAARRLLVLCSYCQRVTDDDEPRRWIEATTYYAEGGSSDVRISHGICADCLSHLMQPDSRAAA